VLSIAHISDLHFGSPFIPRAGAALATALSDLQPDVLVVSGDFTQRAKRTQFEAAQRFLDTLPCRHRVLVPGNHDIPLYRMIERLIQPYRNYRHFINRHLDTITEVSGAVIVGLNTTDPYRRITNGRLRPEQLELCRQAFSETTHDGLRIVVTHHHFAPTPDFERREIVPGAPDVLEALTRLRVDLVLSGHIHRAYVGNSLDIFSGEDRSHGIVVCHCGTSTSRRGRGREREKNSFNWLTIEPNAIQVSHYMYFGESQAFAPISRHRFARSGCGYLTDDVPRDPPDPQWHGSVEQRVEPDPGSGQDRAVPQ